MKKQLEGIIEKAAKGLIKGKGIELPVIVVQAPKNRDYGDFATNLPILLAPLIGEAVPKTAELLVEQLKKGQAANICEKILATGGFVNLKLTQKFLSDHLKTIIRLDSEYGKSDAGGGKKVLVEFVSANPTGPLHIGHGRWAVIGDDISSLLEAVGFKVTREFYVNDVGGQIKKLVASVLARMDGKPVPEGGYGGAYVKDLAEELKSKRGHPEFERILLTTILDGQKKVLKKLDVKFDSFFRESSLHDEKKVEQAVKELIEKGHTAEKEGALWFRSEVLGDDKDRVLVRESGDTTYFAADIAYHLNKFERKFDRLINVWGTDHHGYVKRVKVALGALGFDPKKLEIIIGQLVSLWRGKEQVRMSKRTGEMITLEEVVDEIGKDATRFFLTMASKNSHLDFDLELAKQQASDNPVYYVQYAHARICSIFREAGHHVGARCNAHLHLLIDPSERALMRALLDLPDEMLLAAEKREPHRMVEYARQLAALFHNFYHQCRVITDDAEITSARLALVDAARIVLHNVLKLLKVTAPERM
ncbi:MAG: arginine--tRNA ligase [Candidatus Margulisiibacteriota bacterium]|nr:arginine--tRNA ligase [Candidatus Margulisiibacteriota bacterium]